MQEMKEVQKTVEELDTIVCDRCGAKEKMQDLSGTYVASFRHTFGYLSTKDESRIDFDLCEKCLDEVLTKENINYRLIGPGGR